MRLIRTAVDDASTEYTALDIICYMGKDMVEYDVPVSARTKIVEIPEGAQPGRRNFPKCPDCNGKLLIGGRGAVKCVKCGSEFSVSG